MPPGHSLIMENEHALDTRRAHSVVAEERWQALLGLLIDAEVVSPDDVAAMSERLAQKLEGHARGALGRLTSTPELLEAARRAKNVARLCREVRCG